MLLVKNGMIHDGIHEEAFQADILVEEGKIKAIGQSLEAPEDARVVDAEGLSVYPGFVEAHGHIGLDGYGIGGDGSLCGVAGNHDQSGQTYGNCRQSRLAGGGEGCGYGYH